MTMMMAINVVMVVIEHRLHVVNHLKMTRTVCSYPYPKIGQLSPWCLGIMVGSWISAWAVLSLLSLPTDVWCLMQNRRGMPFADGIKHPIPLPDDWLLHQHRSYILSGWKTRNLFIHWFPHSTVTSVLQRAGGWQATTSTLVSWVLRSCIIVVNVMFRDA